MLMLDILYSIPFLVGSIILLICFCLFTLTVFRKNFIVFLLIPFMIFLGASFYFSLNSVRGYAIERELPEEFYLIWYQIHGNSAEIWITDKTQHSRLYYLTNLGEGDKKQLRDMRGKLVKRIEVKGTRIEKPYEKWSKGKFRYKMEPVNPSDIYKK